MKTVCLLILSLVLAVPLARARLDRQAPEQAAPIDPQRVQDQDTMTWDDYRPIAGTKWADPSMKPTARTLRVALVAVDFEDQPFVITLPKQSDLFGNPQIDPVRPRRSSTVLR